VLVLDARRRPLTWVNADHLRRGGEGRPLREIGLRPDALVEPHATLSDTLNEMLTARYSTAVVVDSSQAFQGIVDIDTINESVRSMRSAEDERLRQQREGEGVHPST
jgi:osmoprotectant transport system ATP-binding protein